MLNINIKFSKKERKAKKVLAISYEGYWKRYPTSKKDIQNSNKDTTLGCIITKLLNNNFDVAALDISTSLIIDIPTLIEKRVMGEGLWRAAESYLSIDIIKDVYKKSMMYEQRWKRLKHDAKFKESLQYEGQQLSESLVNYLDTVFNYRLFLPILYIELIKRAIEVEKPDILLLSCIECPFGAAAIIAGKIKKVPTLDIQHGIIHPHHWAYVLGKPVTSMDNLINYFPLADMTAVYGNYHKYLLTEMSLYPEDSVSITGSPRYDIYYEMEQFYSKEAFFKKYSIPSHNRVILWTFDFSNRDDQENLMESQALFRALEHEENITLIVKPHPSEQKWNIKLVKDTSKNYDINIIMFPRDFDTYELLFVCDLMITRNSTTAMEVLALDKPIIVLNLRKTPDGKDYIDAGVAIGCYNEDDLKIFIKDLLTKNSSNKIPQFAENREKYVKSYLYKIDGKATDRVINLIRAMINDKQ